MAITIQPWSSEVPHRSKQISGAASQSSNDLGGQKKLEDAEGDAPHKTRELANFYGELRWFHMV